MGVASKKVTGLEQKATQDFGAKIERQLSEARKSAQHLHKSAEDASLRLKEMRSDTALQQLRKQMRRKRTRPFANRLLKKKKLEDRRLQMQAENKVSAWFKKFEDSRESATVVRQVHKTAQSAAFEDDLGEGAGIHSVNHAQAVNNAVAQIMYKAEVDVERTALDNLRP